MESASNRRHGLKFASIEIDEASNRQNIHEIPVVGQEFAKRFNVKSNSENKEGKQLSERLPTVTSNNRRKLIRGGVVGAPVLLALKSAPVLAQGCKLPSGFSTSGNLSRNGGATCIDGTFRSPSYWSSTQAQEQGKFKGTGVSVNTKFNAVFGGLDSTKLIDVLAGGGVASLFVAAYLDTFISFVVDANAVKAMWNGTYIPAAGVPAWSREESANYLRYVMGMPLL